MTAKKKDDVQEAFRALVYEFGIEKMAGLLGVSLGTLYNKANLNDSTPHRPSLTEAVLASMIAGNDPRIAKAFCHAIGHVCFPLPDLKHVSDEALLELINNIGAEGGDFYKAVNGALKDGRITAREMKSIDRSASEFVSAILEATERMRGLCVG